jgi:hypothetical protein
MDDGRLNIELEVSQSLRLPPVQLNRELPNEVGSGESNNNSNNTILAESTLISGFAEIGDGHRTHATPRERSANIPAGGMSPAHSQSFNPTSRLEAIGGCLKSQGFPDEVVELLFIRTKNEYQRCISVGVGQLV